MSEIITDKLTGKTSAGDVTITSEGGAVTMQLQQGVAKCWHHYNQSGTLATVDSFNVSSATDSGVGITRTSYTNSLANLGYAVSGSHNLPSSNTASWVTGLDNSADFTTGQVTCSTFNTASGRVDATKALMTLHGDLA